MKNWVEFIAEHHTIHRLASNTIMILDIVHDVENKCVYNDIITKTKTEYIVRTMSQEGKLINTVWYDKIKDYLGY